MSLFFWNNEIRFGSPDGVSVFVSCRPQISLLTTAVGKNSKLALLKIDRNERHSRRSNKTIADVQTINWSKLQSRISRSTGIRYLLSIRAECSRMNFFWELETCCRFGSRALRRPVEVLTRENLQWILAPDPFVFSPVWGVERKNHLLSIKWDNLQDLWKCSASLQPVNLWWDCFE